MSIQVYDMCMDDIRVYDSFRDNLDSIANGGDDKWSFLLRFHLSMDAM